jgi:nitroreductase
LAPVEDSLTMELHEAIGRRSMVRSFSSEPVAEGTVERIVRAALRSPTAGNTRGTAWLVLEGPAQTATYFDATTDAQWRADHPEWSDGLGRAPVVLLAYTSPEAYVARYAEPDKEGSGLGAGGDAWPVPYWYGDAAFGVMAALLAAVDAGLGSCVLGNFRGEDELAARLGVPDGWRLFCAVVLGHSDKGDRRSPSLNRHVPAPSEQVHRGRWNHRVPDSSV